MDRRKFLLTTASIPLALAVPARAIGIDRPVAVRARLAKLEHDSASRLGVCAIDTATMNTIGHRENEGFPFCSTFKLVLVCAILTRSIRENDLLLRRIRYSRADLVHYSPITEKHVGAGMTVGELCAAAMQYSDNSAANLLIKLAGGPPAVTAYARSIGNQAFRLDRRETELNTCIPGDPRDTVTPAAMARSMQDLTLGNTLPPAQRKQLIAWLRANTTGGKCIRAAVPGNWRVGDKTGSGDYGTANDIAVLWPPGRKPIVLAVYSTHADKQAKWSDDLIASATRIVLQDFGFA